MTKITNGLEKLAIGLSLVSLGVASTTFVTGVIGHRFGGDAQLVNNLVRTSLYSGAFFIPAYAAALALNGYNIKNSRRTA